MKPARKGAAGSQPSPDRPLLHEDDALFDTMEEESSSAARALARLAGARERGRLAHALLLAGPAGSGKRWCATRLAQLLACVRAPAGALRPCLSCVECQRTERGLDQDVMVLEPPMDEKKGERKAEIPVEQVRATRERLTMRTAGTRRVVLVDPADRLSLIAQEALLKTLEEPPPGVTILLLSSRPSFLKPTVRSRSALVRIAPPSPDVLARALERRGLDAPSAALAARLSRGDVRRAAALDATAAADAWLARARQIYELLGQKGERRARDLALEIAPSKGEDGGGREDMLRELDLLEAMLRDALIAGEQAGDGLAARLVNPSAEKAARSLSQRLPGDAAARGIAAVEAARDDLALNMSPKIVLTHLLLSLRPSPP
jgi:DNA polymerase-3 subunit delta'